MVKNNLFENIDFSEAPISREEYSDCTFVNCSFHAADLSNILFSDCSFKSCDLSLIKTTGSILRDVVFKECKLLGIHFETCNELMFFVSFDHCILNHSSFFEMPLKKMHFKHCSLVEADFTGTDLTAARFEHCDLSGANFDNSNLEKADFRTAQHYSIDPERNRIKQALFSLDGVGGLLRKYNIDIEN